MIGHGLHPQGLLLLLLHLLPIVLVLLHQLPYLEVPFFVLSLNLALPSLDSFVQLLCLFGCYLPVLLSIGCKGPLGLDQLLVDLPLKCSPAFLLYQLHHDDSFVPGLLLE